MDKKFRQYLETIIVSKKKKIRMGVPKTANQKTYKIAVGSHSITIDFLGLNGQFDWIEISLVYNKSDKCTKDIKSVKLSNFNTIYSLTNEKKSLTWKTQHNIICCKNNLSTGAVTAAGRLHQPIK